MRQYPITVVGDAYKGSKENKIRKAQESWRIANKIEKHINNIMKGLPENCIKMFKSYIVASEINEDPETVRKLIMGIDGGSYGMTLYKGDYKKAISHLPSQH